MMAEPNRHAVAGRRGGLKGGKSRMADMTAAERSEFGRRAATMRWDAYRKSEASHHVVRQMIEKIVTTGQAQRLYVRGKISWFAECGHMEESRWMAWCVGTYGIGCSFTDIINDVVEG